MAPTMQWREIRDEPMYKLACKIIELNPGLKWPSAQQISDSWSEDPKERPSVHTLGKKITVLRVETNHSGAKATHRSAAKPNNRADPVTPSKRSTSTQRTPASKKRKLTSPKPRLDIDDSEAVELSSSDEDMDQHETTDDDEGIEMTPKAGRRVLPARPRKTTSKSCIEDSDGENQDAGARNDSDGDDDFDPSREKDNAGTCKSSASSKKNDFAARLAAVKDLDDEEDVAPAPAGDAKSVAASAASFKTAKQEMDDEEEEDDGY